METPISMLLRKKGHILYSVSPDTKVDECIHKMQEYNVAALLVISKETLLGIVSERDITHKIMGCHCDPAKIPAEEIMTTAVTTITPATTVREALQILTRKHFRHLPVMEKSRLTGLISVGDLTKWMLSSQKKEIDSLKKYIAGERQN